MSTRDDSGKRLHDILVFFDCVGSGLEWHELPERRKESFRIAADVTRVQPDTGKETMLGMPRIEPTIRVR